MTSVWRHCKPPPTPPARLPTAGSRRLAPLLQRQKPTPALYAANDPIASLDDAAKVKLLERLEAMARAADSRVREVMAHIAGTWEVVLVARSDGRMAADVRPLVRVSITVIMQDGVGTGRRREQGSSGGGGRFDYAYFTDAVLRDYAERAVHQASVNLAARPAPAGEMTVVLGPGWPGILLHEAVGHGLEGDFNRKGSSTFAGRIGQRVAAKAVTVVDDGTLADRRGSLTSRRRRQPDAAHRADRRRHPRRLPAGHAQRAPDGRPRSPATAAANPSPTCRCRA
jgi:TldD protein